MSIGRDVVATSLPPGDKLVSMARTYSVTQLSQKHNAFDVLMAELEADPDNAEELAAASAWVADEFYAEEGATLRTARLHRGLSQTQLAALLGTSQPQIAKIESGKVDLQYSTLVKLSAALEVDQNHLFQLIAAQSSSSTKRSR